MCISIELSRMRANLRFDYISLNFVSLCIIVFCLAREFGHGLFFVLLKPKHIWDILYDVEKVWYFSILSLSIQSFFIADITSFGCLCHYVWIFTSARFKMYLCSCDFWIFKLSVLRRVFSCTFFALFCFHLLLFALSFVLVIPNASACACPN